MFGLSFEKLLLVAFVAAILIGPQRLPAYSARLAELIRWVRQRVEESRVEAEQATGLQLTREQWEALDPRRYDPRQIIRQALDAAGSAAPETTPAAVGVAASAADTATARTVDSVMTGDDATRAITDADAAVPTVPVESSPVVASPRQVWTEADIARVHPGQRYFVTGGSAHPSRIAIDSLPLDDPLRLAARPVDPAGEARMTAGPMPTRAPVSVTNTPAAPASRTLVTEREPLAVLTDDAPTPGAQNDEENDA